MNYVRWDILKILVIPFTIGIYIGFRCLGMFSELIIKKIVGAILLIISLIYFGKQYFATNSKKSDEKSTTIVKSSPNLLLAIFVGVISGLFTMLANVAGPIVVLFLMKCDLQKLELNGKRAWLFLYVNCLKIPIQLYLNNLKLDKEMLSTIIPCCLLAIAVTIATEKFLMKHIQQSLFERISYLLVMLGAIRLII